MSTYDFIDTVARGPVTARRRAGKAQLAATTSAVRGYYASRAARLKFAVLSLVLCYGGGAFMFWLHAIYRGEQGPPIANQWHWMLDSTLGLLALSPVLLLLLPLADRVGHAHESRRALVLGGTFAVVTTPGPILHDRVAGAGTPLARLATAVFGADPRVVAAHLHVVEHSGASEALLQLAAGLPVYIALAYVVIAVFRRLDHGARPATMWDDDDGTVEDQDLKIAQAA